MSCEKEHSWAWIDPQGKFIPVSHHGSWALEHFPAEAFETALADNAYENLRSQEPAPGISDEMLREIAAGYEVLAGPPPGLLTGTVWQIPEQVRVLAERRGMPTLTKGSWSLRTKLTKVEERFLEALDVYPERIKVVENNRWNRKLTEFWMNYKSQMYEVLLSRARDLLLDRGWALVSNAYAIGYNRPLKSVQWTAFFREVLDCWKKGNLRPPVESESIFVSEGVSSTEYSWADVLDMYADRRMQDEFYEYLLEGSPSALKTVRERAERDSWISTVAPTQAVSPKQVEPLQKARPPKSFERYPNRSQRRASLLIQAWGKVL